MDTYKVHATVKNGQLIIDLPAEFDNIEVEILISRLAAQSVSAEEPYIPDLEDSALLEEPAVLAYQKPLVKPILEVDESGFIPPRQKVDFKQLRGASKLNMTINEVDALARSLRGDSPFVPPRKKIKLSELMGAYKHKMTNDEIDSLTKSWRDEWNRDFS